jgi:hypothetical protein
VSDGKAEIHALVERLTPVDANPRRNCDRN